MLLPDFPSEEKIRIHEFLSCSEFLRRTLGIPMLEFGAILTHPDKGSGPIRNFKIHKSAWDAA
jgi:hypothetical protein